MKHLLRGLFIAVLFICCNFQLVLAQPMQELPVDKNVRIGKLDNGLTYYIRHNALPEKRVEFYIAQKVAACDFADTFCVFTDVRILLVLFLVFFLLIANPHYI